MKKILVITCLAIAVLSVMAIGFIKEQERDNEPNMDTEALINQIEKTLVNEVYQENSFDDFAIEVGTRFIATISKSDLNKAVSIGEIIPEDAYWDRYFILKTHIRIDNYDLEKKVSGNNLALNDAQLALLKRVQYSDNLQFGAEHANSIKTGSLNYMISVVPEKQAEYVGGKGELISYIKDNSAAMITMWRNNQWQAGKINFTVGKQGTITNISLISTSGNPTIDQHMVQLISNTPSNWVPAENAEGEKVEQTLTFSFGNIGC